MRRAVVSYEVEGPPAARRQHPLRRVDPTVEYEAWSIDAEQAAVAALWSDGVLWLAGERVERRVGEGFEALAPGDEAPAGLAEPSTLRWVRLEPEPGSRYVVTAVAPPPPPPGLLARLLRKPQPASPPASVRLEVEIVDEPEPADLLAWLDGLQARGLDLSWVGNEGSPGFVHAIRRPLDERRDVRAALLDHAREDAEIREMIRENAEAWIEDAGGVPVDAGRLVPEDPTGGWIEALEIDCVAENIWSSTGSWLDPGTPNARPGWRCVLPGPAILAALRRYLEDPVIVAVHSAPEEAVLAVHLVGGVNRASGELMGFALQRVWT